MVPPLTVRNLTPTTISLKWIEQFEDPNTLHSKSSAFSFGSGNTTSLAPSASKLGEHAQTFHHKDVDVSLSPFESYTLQSQDLGEDNTNDFSTLASLALRLIIETQKRERYRIDTNPSCRQKSSHLFTPLTPNPSTSFTALYHPAEPSAHVTIHTNHLQDYSTWMAALAPQLPISALSIPGTHNSHTHYRALPSVRCQLVSVKAQLENGIRFLDIRVQPAHATDTSKKDLYLVHGAFPISLTGTKYLDPVLKACYEFLDKHPSETVLVSLKREGIGSATDEHLAEILEKHYIAPNRDRWYTDSKLPYLGDARGKIVLVRRYEWKVKDEGYGLDATAWPYNSTHALHGPFCIQDFCEVLHPSSISQKLQYSNEHLIRSAECTAFIPGINTDTVHPIPAEPLYLNFLSGSNFWRVGCWPEKIAKIVNRGIEEWICMGHHLEDPLTSPRQPSRASIDDGASARRAEAGGLKRKAKSGDGSTGVVVMDCVGEGGDWDLVKMIVGMNMGVQMKGRRMDS